MQNGRARKWSSCCDACTPAREPLDATFFDDVCKQVRGLVLDGALLKVARYLKVYTFANIVIVMRGPGHMIRTSCRDPLHDADVFSDQYERLFGDDQSVLQDCMNSGMRQRQLEEAQTELGKFGDSTPSLTSVQKHMRFVQPRFESFVTPRRRYVCLLRAVAMVLATKAGDGRLDSKVQKRADAALNAMSNFED